ncbi:hypothetical protein ACTNFI_00850, partial [Coxiella burnetii]|uniref:hypothetical protein n=1 Tax=Coxiella burnetii TaxID=777 RepID=UPI003FA5687F
NTQYFNIFHGPSPFFENRNSMLAHYDAVFKGWVHFIGLLSCAGTTGFKFFTLHHLWVMI